MCPLRSVTPLLLAVLPGLLPATPARAAPDGAQVVWSVLSREHGCVDASGLRDQLPDLPEVHTPDAFAAYLDARKLRYSRRDFSISAGRSIAFNVPERGLSLTWTTAPRCPR